MSALVAVVLVAAVLHATWNAIVHAIGDQPAALILYAAGALLVALALLPFVAVPASGARPFVAVSALLHVGYQLFLVAAYRFGDFGQAYPLARGTAPWVVTLVATVFLHERLSSGALVGVLVITVGLGSLVLSAGIPGRAELPAPGFAVATGLFIAAYTLVDGLGVRRSGSPVGYLAWLMLVSSLLTPLSALVHRPRGLLPRLRRHLWAGLLAGAVSVLAYGLVLYAQTRGSLATVSALRETSVVAGALIGAVFFKESYGRVRLLATVLVVAGIVVIEVS